MHLVIFILLIFCSANALGQVDFLTKKQFVFHHLTKENGLSNNQIKAFTQDSEGFIWVGTVDGLNRYDGYSFKVYKHDAEDPFSLPRSNITNLIEGPDGDIIWIGTTNGIVKYDKILDRFEQIEGIDVVIFSLSMDNEGNIFAIGESNLYLKKREDRTFELFSLQDDINPLYVGPMVNGKHILGCEKSVGWLEIESGKYSPISTEFGVKKIIRKSDGDYLFITLQKTILLFNNDGISSFAREENSNWGGSIANMVESSNGKFWIAVRDVGLFFYDENSNTLKSFKPDIYNPTGLSAEGITSLFKDKDGGIWIGTFNKGIDYLDIWDKKFLHIKFDYRTKGMVNNNVRSVYQDRDGDIWIGTKEGGCLSKFEVSSGEFEHYCNDGNAGSINDDYILCIADGFPGFLWVGTFNGGLNLLNKSTGKFKHFKHDPENPGSISQNMVYAVLQDSKNRLWVGTVSKGINLMLPGSDQIIKFENKINKSILSSGKSVRAFLEDSHHTIWVATTTGLGKFNEKENDFHFFDLNSRADPNENFLYCLQEDKRGNLWVGSMGGLHLVNKNTGESFCFSEKQGLPGNIILGILEDNQGNLWISTTSGLSKFTPPSNLDINHLKSGGETGKFINFDLNDGLQGNEFTYNTNYKLSSGEMIFGGPNGFNMFHPDSIQTNPIVPQINFTDFSLFNQPLKVGEENSILSKIPNKLEHIVLNHDQNTFFIGFTAINFSTTTKNQYAYYLEGFEDSWHYEGNIRKVSYTNLDPGEYIFRVKASNNDGVWNEKGRSLKITILTPWWETVWFRVLAGLTLIWMVFAIYRYQTRNIIKQKRILEEKVNGRTIDLQEANLKIQTQNKTLSELNNDLQTQGEELSVQNEELSITLEQLKLAQTQLVQSEKLATLGILTAGIAHEINNPVNFIQAGIAGLDKSISNLIRLINEYENLEEENFVEKKQEIEQLKEKIQLEKLLVLIQKVTGDIGVGAKRTAKIVKDLKSFSQADNQNITFEDIHEGIDSSLVLLKNQFKNRIEIIKNYGELPAIKANHGRLNQVFMNLLINAIQAIEEKGEIYITTTTEEANIKLVIKDTGNGIKKEIRDHIFEPFYSTKDEGKGMGLGLSISLNIIKDHNGQIIVESEEGKGTEFTVVLPIESLS